MIIHNDGTKDTRKVVEVRSGEIYTWAIVLNENGFFEKVMIANNDDPRYDAIDYAIDANEFELKRYRASINDFEEGDLLEVVKGRKYPKGLRGYYISEKVLTFNYEEVVYVNLQTEIDIITIPKNNLEMVIK